MKTISLILCAFLALPVHADPQPAQVGSNPASQTIDDDTAARVVELMKQEKARELKASEERLAKLTTELEQAKGEGAQWWFKRLTAVCGLATAASVVMALASSSDKYGHYFGNSADERLGGAMLGMLGLVTAGPCTIAAGILYEASNGKVEMLDALVKEAEIALRIKQAEASK